MRNLHEVLRQKEMDLVRVRQEVEALRCVAPLLFDRGEQFPHPPELFTPETMPKNRWPLEVDGPPGLSPGA